jgi:hypothetical protein
MHYHLLMVESMGWALRVMRFETAPWKQKSNAARLYVDITP